jgi:polar amino acid transport system substrate-binding protein
MSNAWRLLRGTHSFLVFVFLLASRPMPGFCADHLQTILTRGELRWGADAEGGAPYVYPDPEKPEQLAGFEFDLADAIAAKLGVKAKWCRTNGTSSSPRWIAAISTLSSTAWKSPPTTGNTSRCRCPTTSMRSRLSHAVTARGLTNLDSLKGKTVGRAGVLRGAAPVGTHGRGGFENLSRQRRKFSRPQSPDASTRWCWTCPLRIYYAKNDPALKFSGEPFAPGYYGIGRAQGRRHPAGRHQPGSWRISSATARWSESTANIMCGTNGRRVEGLPARDGRARKSISTLREWPKYLPLLLRGAVVTTVEISVLGMMLAVVAGLVVVLARFMARRRCAGWRGLMWK